MKDVQYSEYNILKDIPEKVNESQILYYLQTKTVNWEHVKTIKKLTGFTDDILSEWLDVSVKTFRSYKKPKHTFKESIQEKILLLLALIKHGISVFGSSKKFDTWLNSENFFFDNKPPIKFLNTVSGIRFVDDQLTAMEYGDNV